MPSNISGPVSVQSWRAAKVMSVCGNSARRHTKDETTSKGQQQVQQERNDLHRNPDSCGSEAPPDRKSVTRVQRKRQSKPDCEPMSSNRGYPSLSLRPRRRFSVPGSTSGAIGYLILSRSRNSWSTRASTSGFPHRAGSCGLVLSAILSARQLPAILTLAAAFWAWVGAPRRRSPRLPNNPFPSTPPQRS